MSIIDNINIIKDRFGMDFYQSGDEMRYKCPFCESKRGKPDNDYKFYVSTKSLKFICFKCNSIGTLRRNIEVSNDSVYNKLLSLKESVNDDEEEYNMFYVPSIDVPKDSTAYRYLARRGITDELIDYYNIRLGVNENFGRIVVPNILYGNEKAFTDMFSARSYIEQTPKYLNPDGAHKTNSVFNLHRQEEGGIVYVVEGVITSICAGKDAVSTYGCSPSDKQIASIIDKNFSEIYCVYDYDPSGIKGNAELSEKLYRKAKIGTKIYMVNMPSGIDAADMGEKDFKEYVHKNKIEYFSSVYAKLRSIIKDGN